MTSLSTQLDINALVEMGFTKDRVELAVRSVKNPDIQTVVEWLFSHPVDNADTGHRLGDTASDSACPQTEGNGSQPPAPDSADITDHSAAAGNEAAINDETSSMEASSEAPAAALSLVCEDCGKQIRNEIDAQTHAARTGHQNFAESSEAIKPLTAEEKEVQRIKLQQKLEERRKEREVAEKEQEKLKEKTRRRTGKEITQAKEEQAYKEMKRLAEERRLEKREEQRLKQKLKDDIARDRAEFKKQHTGTAAPSSKPVPVTAQSNQTMAPKKEYDTSRIQFRLIDGSTQNSTFKADDLLQVIHDYLSEKLGSSFDLSMTFPRKVFNEQDKCKTLKELGLVPSAVLVLKAI